MVEDDDVDGDGDVNRKLQKRGFQVFIYLKITNHHRPLKTSRRETMYVRGGLEGGGGGGGGGGGEGRQSQHSFVDTINGSAVKP